MTIPAGLFGGASFHQGLVNNFSQLEYVVEDEIKAVTVVTITLDDYVNDKKNRSGPYQARCRRVRGVFNAWSQILVL